MGSQETATKPSDKPEVRWEHTVLSRHEPIATYAERAYLRCGHGIITETMPQHARTSQKPHYTIKINTGEAAVLRKNRF